MEGGQIGMSKLEHYIAELVRISEVYTTQKDHALSLLQSSEAQVVQLKQEMAKMQQEEQEKQHAYCQREQRLQQDRATALLEVERVATLNAVLSAKLDSFQHQPILVTPTTTLPTTHHVSTLITKDVIDHLTRIHDQVRELETKTNLINQQTLHFETRQGEWNTAMAKSKQLVQQAEAELTELKQRLCNTPTHEMQAQISGLQFDKQVLEEQGKAFREEIKQLNQIRRGMEVEYAKIKLDFANKLVPLMDTLKN